MPSSNTSAADTHTGPPSASSSRSARLVPAQSLTQLPLRHSRRARCPRHRHQVTAADSRPSFCWTFHNNNNSISMNPEKLAKMQSSARIGGKGTVRRKKKVIHRTATTDDKKLQNTLKKLTVNPIPGIEEVNMIKDDGTVIHFNNPKVQASLAANTFAITGHAETKKITEMVPGILSQLRAENFAHLKSLAPSLGAENVLSGLDNDEAGDDDVPDLVENFDDAAKIQN